MEVFPQFFSSSQNSLTMYSGSGAWVIRERRTRCAGIFHFEFSVERRRAIPRRGFSLEGPSCSSTCFNKVRVKGVSDIWMGVPMEGFSQDQLRGLAGATVNPTGKVSSPFSSAPCLIHTNHYSPCPLPSGEVSISRGSTSYFQVAPSRDGGWGQRWSTATIFVDDASPVVAQLTAPFLKQANLYFAMVSRWWVFL